MRPAMLALALAAAATRLSGEGNGFPRIPEKLVGGNPAEPGAYPWMASLRRVQAGGGNSGHYCAGVLVHPSWVLTAAHCVSGQRPSRLRVVLGAHSVRLEDNPEAQIVDVVEIVLQPSYIFRSSGFDGDVALLRLATPVEDLEPVALASPADLPETGGLFRVAGWGSLVEGGPLASVLQEADLPLVDRAVAAAVLEADGDHLDVDMIPAGNPSGGLGLCFGDSGGPLMVRQGKEWLLAGAASFVIGDCGESLSVFADVSFYRDWIRSVLYLSYVLWSRDFGVGWFESDDDGDSEMNLREFGLGSRPDSPASLPEFGVARRDDQAGLEFLRRRSGADYGIERGPNLTQLSPVEDAAAEWEVLEPGEEEGFERVRLPSSGDDAGFWRIAVRPSADPEEALMLDGPSAYLRGRSQPGSGPDGEIREFRMSGLSAARAFPIQVQAVGFSPRLRIYDSGGSMVWEAGSAGQTMFEELFRAQQGRVYRGELSAFESGETGDYLMFYPQLPGGLEVLLVGAEPLEGWLDENSDFDGSYYSKSYLLAGGAPGDRIAVTMESNAGDEGFRPFLVVLDDREEKMTESAGRPTTRTVVRFRIEEGREYYVFASSLNPEQLGRYTVGAARED
ncbi:MAG TPA: serine protease [Verrucomicrobiales bacterium]|nr:serine protease [Verrucomicrobiales bacterium]